MENKTLKNLINKLQKNSKGNWKSILLLDKPKNITSHDLVNIVRKKLNTRKVGHAGALDPFASGLMIILVGKATKLSSHFTDFDKSYNFDLALGISTTTADPEGSINELDTKKQFSESDIKPVLASLKGKYTQNSPLHSSVRVGGLRLREIVRASKKYIIQKENSSKFVVFSLKPDTRVFRILKNRNKLKDENKYKIQIPKREVFIKTIKLETLYQEKIEKLPINIDSFEKLQIAKISCSVSKGTYIRQLAVDIGQKLNSPAMLTTLRRTRVGEYEIKDSLKIKDLDLLPD